MSRPKGGLGRGLAALIPTGPQTDVVANVFMGGSGSPIAVQIDEAVSAEDSRASGDPDPAGGEAESPAHSVDSHAYHNEGLGGAKLAPDGSPTEVANGAAAPTSRMSRPSVQTVNGHAPVDPDARNTPAVQHGSPETASGTRTDGPRYEEVPIDRIRPNPRNPRTVFDEEAMTELEHSLREFGLLQPIVVRQIDDGYELVMGERRWRAAERAGLSTIPAIIRRTEDANLLRDALLENIHRANLNPLEEAAAYQQLLQEFGVTQEELAARIGRSRPVISNTIRLLKLPIPVQRRVAAGVLSAGHARALLSLESPEDQEELATRVVAEGLSVRGTEEAVVLMAGRTTKSKRAAPKKLVMPSLAALASTLSDTFDTRVRVELGRQKGRLIVEFATVDDLERIVDIMAPSAAERRGTESALQEMD